MTHHLFLSPHFDDAIGSCGGRIWRLHRGGHQTHVLTVFGGNETLPLSDTAVRFHAAAGGLSGVAVRFQEDRAACKVLRCSADHLAYPDVIYRRGTDGEPLLPGASSAIELATAQDAELGDSIADDVVARLPDPETIVYCPMAIGRHVDHLLTRNCGLRLVQRGVAVLFYADFFYSAHSVAARSIPPDRLTIAEFARKLAAFSNYRSQIKAMFGSTPRMLLHFHRYGRSERFVRSSEFAMTVQFPRNKS